MADIRRITGRRFPASLLIMAANHQTMAGNRRTTVADRQTMADNPRTMVAIPRIMAANRRTTVEGRLMAEVAANLPVEEAAASPQVAGVNLPVAENHLVAEVAGLRAVVVDTSRSRRYET
jgi:hypothetical protein